MALAVSPVTAAAIESPPLAVSEWVSVWALQRDFSTRNLLNRCVHGRRGGLGWLRANVRADPGPDRDRPELTGIHLS